MNTTKMSNIEKIGTIIAYALVLGGVIVYGRDLTNWLRHRTPPQLIDMQGVVVDIDHKANTFVIIENGELREYNVDGKMPLGIGMGVAISYRPSFHWYRFAWQDKNEIEIGQVIEAVNVSPKHIDNSPNMLDDQIFRALQTHAPTKEDKLKVGDTVEVP